MKKRILFVEDNPLLLAMYGMMMEAESDHWEVATIADPQQALTLMRESTFDAVVSDLRMPSMNGIEFLTRVRDHFPGCARIMISGLDDQAEVIRCLNTTHQFLTKPVDAKVLRSTLARLGGLEAYLRDQRLKEVVGQLDSFPSFPSLYLKIMSELSSPEPSVEAISEVISQDPGMTAKMLHLVNSAALGISRRISSPFEAVQFLGVDTVRSLVLSTHIFSCFEHTRLQGMSVSELWRHTFRTGRLSRRLIETEQAESSEAEEANIAGVLHDVGKLMLADGLPDQFQRALALSTEEKIPLVQAETRVLGTTHAGVAAYLLSLWGFPATIVEAVAFHHTPDRTQIRIFSPLAAVHVANVLEHEISQTINGVRCMDSAYLESIGAADRVDKWREIAQRELRKA
jgi:HD-like signal output (HDOD) protein/CheY-like chemotaxis protein